MWLRPKSGAPLVVIVVQLLSFVQLFAAPWTAAHQAPCPSPSPSNSCPLSQCPLSHLILCCPLLLLPSVFPSIRVFSNELALPIMWPNYKNFGFSISPSNEYSEFISFRIDWFDLLVVQGNPKSPLQHRSSKASILQYSAFFLVQI